MVAGLRPQQGRDLCISCKAYLGSDRPNHDYCSQYLSLVQQQEHFKLVNELFRYSHCDKNKFIYDYILCTVEFIVVMKVLFKDHD